MKTFPKQYAFAAPVIIAIVIILSSFVSAKRNSVANGGGIADGIHFSFNAVEQKDGAVVGYIHYGENDYTVSCAMWFGTSAILSTTDGHSFYVSDNGSVDWISDPIVAQCSPYLSPSDFFGLHCVSSGNIQVKE